MKNLFDAITHNNIEEVKRLIEEGNNVNVQDLNIMGWTPLMWAIMLSRTEIAKFLLTIPNIDVSIIGDDGTTALSHASYLGHVEIEELIDDLEKKDDNLKQNLVKIQKLLEEQDSFYTYTDIIKLLLAIPGVDLKTKGKEVLKKAANWDSLRLHENLIKAIKCNNTTRIKQFLNEGACVNSKDEWGDTLLIWAIKSSNLEIAELLLAHPKINIDARDRWNHTPLSWAIHYGNPTIVKLLNNFKNK